MTDREPLDILKAGERARARRKILGGVEGARRREELAAALDDTRTWVDPNGYRLSDRIWNARQYDRDQIDRVLRESIARGDDPIQTARRIERYLTPQGARQTTATPRGGRGMYAARRLARTETTRAFGQGTIEAAKRARFVTKIGWRTSGRHDPKIDHGVCAANQQRGPYAPDDVPRYPAHPNCRCVLLPIPEDPMKIAEKLRRDLDRDNARIDPFNPPQAVLKQEAAIRPQKFESAAVFDQAGRRTLFKDGTTSAVHFTDAEMALMKNAVLTHNHPGGWNYPADDVRRMGNSLGRADVSLAVEADLAAIRAVSPTADYTLARPEGGWGMTGKQAQAQMQGAFDEVRVEFNEAIRNGEITYKQAEAYNNHEALSRVAERNGWRYERRMIE